MLSIISANFGALSGLYDLNVRMKMAPNSPDKAAARQSNDVATHMAYMRKSSAVIPPSTMYKNKHFMPRAVLDTTTPPSTSRLLREVKVAWDTATRTRKFVDELSATAVSPIDVNAEPTPEPDSASNPSSATIEPEKGASCDNPALAAKKLAGLQWLIEQKDRDCEDMHAECEHSNLQVQDLRENYMILEGKNAILEHNHTILEDKYKMQIAQRVNDKKKVDEAHQYCQAVEGDCAGLEAKFDANQIEHASTVEKLNTQLADRDQRLAKIEDDQRRAIAALEASNKKELAAKTEEVKQALGVVKLEQSNFEFTKRELLRVLEVADSNRKTWAQEKQEMVFRAEVSKADADETLRENESEIMRLTERKRILENEVSLLSSPIGHSKEIINAITNSAAIREELRVTRRENIILKEKLENTLDSAQTDRDIWVADRKEETEGRAYAHELKRQVDTLKEKLLLREDVIRGMEQRNISSDMFQKDMPGSGVGLMVLVENDSLRNQLKALEQAKQEIQTKYNKLDDDSLDMLIRIGDIEKLAKEDKTELESLRAYKVLAKKELWILSQVWEQSGLIVFKDHEELRQHLRDTTEQNQVLSQQVIEMKAELEQKRDCAARVNDEADTLCRSHANEAEYYTGLYFDEAVPHVERLYAEIKDLNIELGRHVEPNEKIVRNLRVENRAVLRNACMYTMKGVDTAKIPAEYYEPGFVPGVVAATYDALRVLRPLGWVPLYKKDKVYLRPMYKPFTEEDAVFRLEAQQQKEQEKQDRVARDMLLSIAIAKNKPKQDRSAPPPHGALSTKFVPRQVLDRSIVGKKVRSTAFSVAKSPTIHANKGPYAQQSSSTQIAVVDGPPWESRFTKFQDMTKADYEDMDSELKQHFIETYVKGSEQ